MSWKTLNKILGRAMIDDKFARRLLANPLRTAQEAGFDLSLEEQIIFQSIKARDIAEFSQILLDQLKTEEE
ncbi:MAG TPA: Os1348 family NHLP clan protein [Ktedonobacteraceae bacterium]|nr:Os1348 family NHLP clan protein [Ktedonobacteraceae bacterium]